MPSPQQNLIWTVLPNGVTDGLFQFSVIVSPRLLNGATLATFPDWAASGGVGRTWADTLAGVKFSLEFPDLTGSPVLAAIRLTPTSTPATKAVPTPAVCASRFPASTPVTSWTYPGFDTVKLRSYPMATISNFLAYQYGKFGVQSPTAFPSYPDLVASGAFGPIGFEDDNTSVDRPISDTTFGPRRKIDLLANLEKMLAAGPIAPFPDVNPGSATYNPTNLSYSFLEAETFLRRLLPPSITSAAPLSSPAPPPLDFAQLVGMAGSMPTLMRYLGLVVDCTVDASHLTGLSGGLKSRVKLIISGFSALLEPTYSVFPYTQTLIGTKYFRAQALTPGDYANGMLLLGDLALYQVINVDPDGSAIKTMQFADTVTRSRRDEKPFTDSTPSNYSLPALRTGGFAFARTGRAVQMAATLTRQRKQLEDQATFSSTVTSATPVPLLYADDITRGIRIDVFDVADGVWRSVMWREADGWDPGDGDPITLIEEDTVVPAPATAAKSTNPKDLYLQDSLTSWAGWSPAVPRLGLPAQTGDPTIVTPPPPNWTVPQWRIPGDAVNPQTAATNSMRLPRLRFGRIYRFRARAVDLAGNGLSVAAAPTAGGPVTGARAYLRFEPVEAPRLLLTAPHTPGESAEVMVIRSESLNVDSNGQLDNGSVLRLLIPSRSSVLRAEQHGVFHLTAQTGDPLDSSMSRYNDIAARDQAPIASAPILSTSPQDPTAPDRPNPEVYYNTNALPVAYLPDVLAHTAVVRNLPPSGVPGSTTASLPFGTAGLGWPQFQACRIMLARSSEPPPLGVPASWSTGLYTPGGGTTTTELAVLLPKGEMVTAQVNCLLTPADLDVMAIRSWVIQWAAANGQSPEAALAAMAAGSHWMVTPWRDVTFVHAVRTPLTPPVLEPFHPTRTTVGQTSATFPTSTVSFNRASTGRIDLLANWAMPIDTGSNPDPVTPVPFRARAFSIDIDRTGPGPYQKLETYPLPFTGGEPLTEIEEFNDTKFRLVNYRSIATTYYLEYFREQRQINLTANGTAFTPGIAFNVQTVELYTTPRPGVSPQKLIGVPPGTPVDASPAPGDYVVGFGGAPDAYNPALDGTVALLVNGKAAQALGPGGSGAFTMSYVAPEIYNFFEVDGVVIPSSVRPAAPDVLYVVPIYQRTPTSTGVTRTGGALRVYLNRPWWSSGGGELLGVVCCPTSSLTHDLPPAALAPFVTQSGFDPIYSSTTSMPAQPNPADFPLRVSADLGGLDWDPIELTLEEAAGFVTVAGHEVGFDSSRGLWYCDIQMLSGGVELGSYMPFVRLALARFQPNSLSPLYLSRVVLTDFAQLAPDRFVTVAPVGLIPGTDDFLYNVSVAGRAPTRTQAHSAPNRLTVTVEQQDTRITDDALAWSPTPDWPVFDLDPPAITKTDYVTWTGGVRVRGSTESQRLTFQEYERFGAGTTSERLVFTETFGLT